MAEYDPNDPFANYDPDDPLAGMSDNEDDELKSDEIPFVRVATPPPQPAMSGDELALQHIPDNRPPREIQAARDIAMVADGIIAVSLERNFMDNDAARKCMAVLNYATPDMMNPQVQDALIRAKPHLNLRSAFDNKMVHGFAVGINRTALTMCKGLALASVARVLLNACLKKMGLEAKGRERLLSLTTTIRRQMDDICRRTQQFSAVMARTVERMGTTAFLIENGADIEGLVQRLQETERDLFQEVASVSEETERSSQIITDGCEYIQSIIQDDTRLEDRKRYVEDARQRWVEQQDNLQRLNERYYSEEAAVMFDIENHKGRVKMFERQYSAREEDFRSQTQRLHHINESIGRFEQMKETVKSDRVAAVSSGSSIKKAAFKATQEEIKAQTEAYEAQIRRLQSRVRALGNEASQYRAESLVASDGTEVLVTRERSGALFWAKKTVRQERRRVRPNEKRRLEELAEQAVAERRETEKELEKLMSEKNQVRSRVMDRLRQEHLRIATNDEEYTRQRHGENLREIDQQLRYFDELKSTLEATRRKTEEQMEVLGIELTKERRMLQSFERKLEVLHGSDNVTRKRQREAAQRTEELREIYETRRQEYEKLVRAFGIENNQDFATFMKVFQMLNTAVQNLPLAMKLLQQSFQGAYNTFNGEFLRKDFQTIPEKKRAKTLMRVANDMRAICELGWEYFEAPLLNLLEVDANIVLGKLVRLEEEQHKALEDGEPVVEEVQEEDELPRRITSSHKPRG